MRCLGWFLLASLGLLAVMPAAAQTRDEKACLVDPHGPNTIAACNRLIGKVNGDIKLVASGKLRPAKGWTNDSVLSALYNLRGGAYQTIARRHAANEESEKATEFHLRAIADFDAALGHDPASPHAFLNRGRSRAELVELDSAIGDFEQALRLDPKNAQKTNAKAFNNRGGAHREKGDYAAALADLGRAIELQPRFVDALFNRGTAHLQKEDYDRAIADYTAAMRYGPRDIDTLAARGRAWRDKGDSKRAMTDFEAALALPPPDKRSKSVQDAVRELLRALQEKAEREEAQRRRAQREEAERKAAALREAEAAEAARQEAARAEAARERAEAAEAARREAARREAERQEIARERAEAAEAARRDAERAEAARKEAARRKAAEEAARAEAARKEALRLKVELEEAERQEAVRRKQAQEEARRAQAARKEAERLTAEREAAERKEAASRKAAEESAARERTRRIALVIGNSDYHWLGKLNNPRNDAGDVAKTLESLNFTVFRGIDLTHAQMKHMLDRFALAAQGADTAVFFFGGHGVQDDGVNYLAPIDAGRTDITGRMDLGQFVRLQSVMVDLASGSGIRILIIDACRDNPGVIKRTASRQDARARSVITVRGLTREDVPVASQGGMFVAYAALPGEVAADGVGRNSPFAGSLLKHLSTPGLELRHLFIRVRAEVVAATSKQQTPEVVDRLSKEFAFKPAQ